jgi:hypothetical protein
MSQETEVTHGYAADKDGLVKRLHRTPRGGTHGSPTNPLLSA